MSEEENKKAVETRRKEEDAIRKAEEARIRAEKEREIQIALREELKRKTPKNERDDD